jgi:UDP-GlcNAc:undecaprenyl-phosphate GlcNAc-1-phosphate transferase
MVLALANLDDMPAFSLDEVLSPYVYVFYAAFIVAFLYTPVMRSVARYFGIIDQPDARKVHTKPVAYLGGVAVFLGWISGMAMSQFVFLQRQSPGLPVLVVRFGIVAGACIIVALGLWDDVKKISPRVKIAGQVVAALLLIASGVGTHMTEHFFKPIIDRTDIFFGWSPDPVIYQWFVYFTSCALVIALVVFCCNATNLMDGLDGLCGGVTAIIAAGFLFLAVHLAMHLGGWWTNWDALRVVLGLSLLGAVLAFVPFNFNPASIFMGDAGSMFLGFACALMIILMGEVASKWFLAALVMFSLPILDTSLAFARRYVNRRPVFSADKHHFHHQLVARGLTVRRAVVLSYALAIFFVVCGAAIVFMRTRYAVAFYIWIFGSIMVAAYKMGMVHERPVVVKRRTIDDGSDVIQPTRAVEPDSVLEVQDENRPTKTAAVPGAWERSDGPSSVR